MVRMELEMCNGHSVLIKRVCGRELEPVMCDGHWRSETLGQAATPSLA